MCICDRRLPLRLAALFGVKLTLVASSDLILTLQDERLQRGDRVGLIGGRPDYPLALRLLYPDFEIIPVDVPAGRLQNPAERTAAIGFEQETPKRASRWSPSDLRGRNGSQLS